MPGMDELTRYVVIRAADATSAQHLPPGLDGRWYERSQLGGQRVGSGHVTPGGILAKAEPAARFETRDSDGARAEVYEIRI